MTVDKDKNREYYLSENSAPCDCDVCRYFCSHIRSAHPEIAEYLDPMNVDIERPLELIWYENDDRGNVTFYGCQYVVFGECESDFEYHIGNIGFSNNIGCHPSTNIDEKHFVLDFGEISMNMEELQMHGKIKEYIHTNKERLLSLIYELVAVQSVKGEPAEGAPFGVGPRAALDKMAGICRRAGFDTKICADVVGTADLSPNGDFPELGILCHLDVVPAAGQDGWLTDPFKMIEKDGTIYGRGVIDDKGPLAAAFAAMKCIKDLGIPLKKGVRLIFGTDEENGSNDLKIYLEKEKLPKNVFTPDAAFPVINIEKGMMRSRFSGSYKGGNIVRFRGGSIPNAVPEKAMCELRGISVEDIVNAAEADMTGAKFSVSVKGGNTIIRCKGRAAHAATPEGGLNAVTALISLLCRLPLENGPQRDILHGIITAFPFGETDGFGAGLRCSDERSGALTLVLSIFNMENGRCGGCIDVRFPTCMMLAEVEAAERSALARAGLGLDSYMGDEAHITDENSEFVQKLLEVYERCEGEKGHCIAIGGGTYVHNIEGGVAFGAERGDTDYRMHGANEFITVDELLKDAVLYAEAILAICG